MPVSIIVPAWGHVQKANTGKARERRRAVWLKLTNSTAAGIADASVHRWYGIPISQLGLQADAYR